MGEDTPVGTAIRPSTIVQGSFWAFGGQAALALTTLLTIPFLVRYLGADGYGIYSLINVIISYLVFADLGMGVASTRFGSRALSRGDATEESQIVWTSLVINGVPTILIVAALFIAAFDLLNLFVDAAVPLLHDGVLGLRIAAFAYLFRALAQVLNTPQLTRMRMDLTTKVTAATVVFQACATVIVLIAGGRLVAVMLVMLLAAIGGTVAMYLVSARLLPESAKPQLASKLVRPILAFGVPMMLSYLSSVVLGNAEKLFLAFFDSVVSLAHYSVAFTVASSFALVSSALNQSLVPVFARLQAESQTLEARRLCSNLIRWILLTSLPTAAIMIVASRPFFTVWAGAEFGRESSIPFMILIVGAVLNLLANIPYIVLMSYGRSDLIARYHLLQLAPYLIVAGWLTYSMGAVGAALAWTLRNFVDLVQLGAGAIGTDVLVPSSTARRVGTVLLPTTALLIGTSAAFILSGLSLLLVCVACLVAYALLSWFIVLDNEEKSFLRRLSRLESGA